MSTTKTSKDISNKIALYLLGAVILLGSAWFLFYSPQLTKLNETNLQVQAIEDDINELNDLSLATEQLRENYIEVAQERDRILALLPVDTDEDRLLALLSSIEQQSSVVLSSFTPEFSQIGSQNLVENSGFGIYSARISLEGTYDQLVSFFDQLQSSARFIDIRDFSVDGGASSDDPTLEASLLFDTYYQDTGFESSIDQAGVSR